MISHHHTHSNTAASPAATNLQLSASLAQEIFPPLASQSAGASEDFCTPKYPQKPRKKRTKFIRIDSPNGASSSSASGVVPAKTKSGKKPDPSAPKITEPCSECGRKFWSVKALFGHMRCHPERQWRGINPPPNFRRSVQAKKEAETELTEEDHEVAACLLMLARTPNAFTNTNSSATANAGASSDYSLLETESMVREVDCRFECSSCKKVFGSHQALGGHRASHKNVKGCFAITRSDSTEEELVVENHNNVIGGGGGGGGELMRRRGDNEEEEEEEMMMVMGGGHKCGICLRVFSSGQALGGHKRCHWERGDEPPQREEEGGGGGLDLNLPAPVEHDPFPSYSSALALDLRLGI